MFLLHTSTGNLIRVEDLDELFNPACSRIMGRDQAGEEEQELAWFCKDGLAFPSGEAIPRCWTDTNYRHAHPAAATKREKQLAAQVEMEI